MTVHLLIDTARRYWACHGDLTLLFGTTCPDNPQPQPLDSFLERLATEDRARFSALFNAPASSPDTHNTFHSLTLSIQAVGSTGYCHCILEGYVTVQGSGGTGSFVGTLRREDPEQDLDNILNFSGDMLALLNTDLQIVKLNKAYAGMFKKTPMDLVGKTVREAFSHDTGHYDAVVGPILQKCLRGVPTTFKEWVDVPDYGRMHLTIQYSPVPDAAGRIEGVAVVCQDTTQIMLSVEALRDSEELLRRNEALAKLGGWEYDVDSGAMRWTAQMYEIHGVDRSFNPSNETLEKQFTPADWAILASNMDKNLAGEATESVVGMTVPGGEKKWVRVLAFPIPDDTGRITQVRGALQDVTKLVNNEKELEARKNMFETLAETTSDVISRLDRNRRHIYMNSAISPYTGKQKEFFIGKTYAECELHPDALGFWETLVDKVFETGKPATSTLHAKDLEGIKHIFDTRVFPELDNEGHVESVVSISREITERIRHEEEMLKLEKLQSLGLLAGGIAHDFNNTLTMLFGNIFLAKSEVAEGSPAHGYLLKVEEAYDRTARLTNQLLTFAKGGSPIKKRIPLKSFINDVVSFDLSLRGSNIRPVVDVAPDLMDIFADQAQLEQVFTNLILNAVQSMPDGGELKITAANASIHSRPDDESQESRVLITLADEGVGIPDNVISRIFDPYFSTKTSGSGLGLATVYSIINRHQGKIEVQSVPGKGTVFSILLPVDKEALSEFNEARNSQPKPVNMDPVKGGRILFMDDEKMICDLAVNILKRVGYSVEVVNEGRQAIEKYRQSLDDNSHFDCVIMDLTIPGGMGGREAIGEILKLDPDASVIVSSGYSEDPVMSNYDEFGFKGVLPKPFTPLIMREVVQAIVGGEGH